MGRQSGLSPRRHAEPARRRARLQGVHCQRSRRRGQPVVTRHEYTLVDVFTDRKFGGNQLAVFHDGAGVSDALMHAAAKELNLTEITFVVRAEHGGDHKIRIFSPTRELPFAGHPTIGTAFVLARGRNATLRLEEQVGTLQVTVRDGFTEMEQPLPTFERVADRDAVAASLALDAADLEPALPIEIGSSGLRFMFVAVKTLDAVRRASPRELAEAAYIFTTTHDRAGFHRARAHVWAGDRRGSRD